ncbi:hypothetical protein ACPCUK_14970 [Streptomyces arboris]|uniref:hypothetical protein n=1 Tax=Streptomyces arboris TaxID=2600619 RepID=UPI003C2D9B56
MNAPAKPDGLLSKREFNHFRDLRRRYCAHELDQRESLQTETTYGPVYVLLSRSLPPGTSPEAYRRPF